ERKKMKKTVNLLSLLLSIALFCSFLSAVAYAEEGFETGIIESKKSFEISVEEASGIFGEGLTWSLDSKGTLTISGEGDMPDFYSETPWQYLEFYTLVIENGITSIGDYAFSDSSYLESVYISDTVTRIGYGAFEFCCSLLEINIPNSVLTIDSIAFRICSSLKSINIPDSVESIGARAFMYCYSLDNITLGNSISYIGEDAFHDSGYFNNSQNWENEVLYIGEYLIASYLDYIDEKYYSIKEGTKYIVGNAFCFNSSLETVIIPDSVEIIGENAFLDCNIKSVNIPKNVSIIEEYAFGYSENNADSKIEGFTISGSKGSSAEKYAFENGFTFIEHQETTVSEKEREIYIDIENKTMPNISEKTTASSIIERHSKYGIVSMVKDKNGNPLAESEKVGTGSVVSDENGNEYTVIVHGDVDGTGVVDSTDYLKIKSVFLGSEALEGIYFDAANVDNDEFISSTDYLRIKSYFLGNHNLYA
ncbi:MAG: leucine-rich repeat protein, partial [Clostridia bacterium]|nr:leucine-rich repeat protein [Clostridia bacterium]